MSELFDQIYIRKTICAFAATVTILQSYRFWWAQFHQMSRPLMGNCWRHIWPILKICSLYHLIFVTGESVSVTLIMTNRVEQFTNPLKSLTKM